MLPNEISFWERFERKPEANMTFKKQELLSKSFTLIDVGSFKIRAISGKLIWNNIEVIWFWEKRQEQESFILWEMYDVQTITENIEQVLEKCKKWKKETDYISNIINQFFLFSHPMNHVRKNENEPITEDELYSIIKNIEKTCLWLAVDEIGQKTWYSKADIKLIMSSISGITLDGKKIVNPIGKAWKNIKIYITNIFVPLSEFDIISKMFYALWLEKVEFMPFEYAIFKLFDESQNLCVVNIGNSKTYVSVQSDEYVLWTSRIPIWMNDLIKKIKDKYGFTKIEILKNIDSYFEEEKKEFLEIFEDCIATALKDIVKQSVCPEHFFLIGGGGNNDFMKDFFKSLNLSKHGVKIAKKIELVDIPEVPIKHADFLKNTSNIELCAMMLAYQYFDKKRNSAISRFLAKAVYEIEHE